MTEYYGNYLRDIAIERAKGTDRESTVKTSGGILRPGQSAETLRIQSDIKTLQSRLSSFDTKIAEKEQRQERLAYEMAFYEHGAKTRKKEIRHESLDRIINRLKKQRIETERALTGAQAALIAEQTRIAVEKKNKKIANATREIRSELKHLLALARQDLLGGEQDPRQLAILKWQIEQYANVLEAIEEGRFRIDPGDSSSTILATLSERMRAADRVRDLNPRDRSSMVSVVG